MIIPGDIHLGFFSALTLYIYRIAAHRENHGWNCDGEWEWGLMVPDFSGAQISLLLSHISGFCDRNRGPFHGLS